MPDIAMCKGRDKWRVCPHALTCYRATATPTPDRQSWFAVLPLRADDNCEHHWPTPSPTTPTPETKETP